MLLEATVGICVIILLSIWIVSYKITRVDKNPTSILPLSLSIKRDKGMIVTHASGNILTEMGLTTKHLTGKKVYDVLPSHIVDNMMQAWEEAFNGRHANFISYIDGRSYNVMVKPIFKESGFDPKPVSEVVSIAVETQQSAPTPTPSKTDIGDKLEKAIDTAFRYDHMAVVILLQLEGLDVISATFSPDQVGEYLQQLQFRIQNSLRAGDTIVKGEKGKFTILLPHVQRKDFASYILEDILNNSCHPIVVAGYEVIAPFTHRTLFFPDDGNGIYNDILMKVK
ncbi:GGDEF domain protein [compost metagenome]